MTRVTEPAKFGCFGCGMPFAQEHPGPTKCPYCGGLYVLWVNYKLWTGEAK